MNAKIICVLIVLFTVSSCTKEYYTITEEQKTVTVPELNPKLYLRSADNPENLVKDISFFLTDSTALTVLPHLTENKKFKMAFEVPDSTIVTVDSTLQISGTTENDFMQPVTYEFTKGSQKKTITVTVNNYTNVPLLYATTESAVNSKDEWINGYLTIDGNGDGLGISEKISIKMKGRGNSTWGMPKKPYAIKLDSKTSVLGIPEAKNWVLLANYSDKTLMRTNIAFEMAQTLSIGFTPRDKFVDLILNGEYLGTYLLTEKIELGENRVNIEKLSKKDTDPDIITGGYLLEIDTRLDADTWFRTDLKNTPITFKEPEVPNAQQLNYLKGYINDFEQALFSDTFKDVQNGYAKYIDLQSFADWYLVNELTKNNDAILFSSVFLNKDRNGKLKMGPVWDFDISMGNVNYNNNENPEGWWIAKSTWFGRMLQDPAFVTIVKNRWRYLKAKMLNDINARINKQAELLAYAQIENFRKWNITYQQVWPNAVVLGSYANEVQYLKNWLRKRIAWIDNEVIDL